VKKFIPFLLALFVVAAILRIDFYFTIVYLFFGVYALSRVWSQRTISGLRMERQFISRAFPGDQVDVTVRVQNRTWLPMPWVELQESVPVALRYAPSYTQVFPLGPHGTRKFTYTLDCRQRGYYSVGPMIIHTGDLLGMLPERHAQHAATPFVVYPRIVAIEHLGLPTRAPQAALPAPQPLFEDPTRVTRVRDYDRGDSPRRIHWTASARMGRLLVKQYQPAVARETLICLDMNMEDYGHRQRSTATELAIVVAASVANHIVTREKLPVGLATRAHDPLAEHAVDFFIPPSAERSQLMGVLEVLARAQALTGASFDDVLRRDTMSLSWGATVLVITGSHTGGTMDTLAYLKRRGYAVTIILVQPSPMDVDQDSLAAHAGMAVYRVWNVADLETLA